MPNLMSTSYGDDSVTTRTQGDPYTLPPANDFFTNMVNRRWQQQRPSGRGAAVAGSKPRPLPAVGRRPAYMEELERLKAFDQYDGTLRSAAMRPVGVGAQMIPGMAVDERLLPTRMRAQNAVGGQLFPDAAESKAAPSPGLAGQYSSGAGPDTGLQYMSPAERARWAQLLGRG